jgi:hypothetical protein
VVTQRPGSAAFLAKLAGAGITAKSETGLWGADLSGSLRPVARAGQALDVAGVPRTISKLGVFETPGFAKGQSRSVDAVSGHLVFRATFADKTSAICAATPAAAGFHVETVAWSGEASVPGVAGGRWGTFGSPSVNAAGQVVFFATVAGASEADNTSGIWLDSGSGAALVARVGGVAPDSGGAAFGQIEEPVLNNRGEVAFIGALAGNNAGGLWATTGGTLRLVASQGGDAPGAGGAKFAGFKQVVLPDHGGPVFVAKLSGAPKAMKTGLWSAGADGEVRLMGRTGDLVQVGGATKVVGSFSVFAVRPQVAGQSRNFDATTRAVAFVATFTDGTWAVMEAAAP